jgi:hypothetical protein
MTPQMTLDERLDWMWSTVETLAGLFDMDDDTLTYTVFEPLDIDVGTVLSEANLTALAVEGVLPVPLSRKLIAVGTEVSGLIRRVHDQGDYRASSLRQSQPWAQVAGDCRVLLAYRVVSPDAEQF